jgi:hypothetical protein
MRITVKNLICGDVVEQAGYQATFIGQSPHPRYPDLALVVWRMSDGSVSLDALSYDQEVGELVHDPDDWVGRNARLEAALAWPATPAG